MTIVKTAISIQKNLFQQVDEIAKELKISRSRVFVLAAEDFIRRYENKLLLEQINLAYTDGLDLDKEEQETLLRGQRKFIKAIKSNEW